MRFVLAPAVVLISTACSGRQAVASHEAGVASRDDSARRVIARPQGHGVSQGSDSVYLALRKDYELALRTKYEQSLRSKDRTGDTAVYHADSLALRDLEGHLRPLIGPLTVAGFSGGGRINPTTLLPGDIDSGMPDGLRYASRDGGARMFVTTPALLRAWIADYFAGDSTVPRDPFVALSDEKVYSPMLGDDAAVVRYADLPVSDPHRRVLAAMLVDRAQDDCFDCRPGAVLLSVNAGDRIFVVDAPARDTIEIPARCQRAAKADTVPPPAFEAYRRNGLKDTSAFDRSEHAEVQNFAELLRCYGDGIRSDPGFAQLVSQARGLIEALPDR